jgi:hypothetical protein
MKPMKNKVIFGLFLFVLFSASVTVQAEDRTILQLKIYTIESELQELRMDQFLKDAYIPALHRAGIRHVGVFKPVSDDPLNGKRIFVLIPFRDISQFEQIDRVLGTDDQYLASGTDYIDAAHDDPPYARIESILLRAFSAMPDYGVPVHTTPHAERVYELRSYQGATEKRYEKKVEMFNEGGETRLFLDLGFQPIFFGEVISGPDMPNLMYFTTFENKTAQDQHWETFRNSPGWTALKSDPQFKNTVSHIDKFLLYPTDYSEL